ncbi:Protein msp1, mitochondrial [Neolecta irregularis DAH-3]|uniref:dynamin GTPase n=1 Tax=Neolecta irregularis (strain DAH-3) TaxID=1198029 RepID=A0A1U7LTS3_NEOID|nr:Protein msp1, mitochondrial [Neolecta irregularis DAH-3]|eukprot:OLL25983.1 Protein msp1, mitochondrial [Neolecta irregularis DAH-3]
MIRRFHSLLRSRSAIHHQRNTRLYSSPVAKALLRSLRFPALGAGAGVSILVWADNKFAEAAGYTKAIWDSTADTLAKSWSNIADAAGWFRFNGHSNKDPKSTTTITVAAATAAAYALADDDDLENTRNPFDANHDDQIIALTKTMIEIRTLLQQAGNTTALIMPSIVVIGSQSSGKSSLLETIVGHEFLPKCLRSPYIFTNSLRGNNMVTRRPVELTLIHTPDSASEYGEFPALKLGRITDFSQIQKTLTDLNLAVSEWVTDDPIQLNIYSPRVPDLSLIDLPGYIQVTNQDQPDRLREEIELLCEKYIKPPNVILAVCAADIDLANSTALRASKQVDPKGDRTLGVITKMDLIPAQEGFEILSNNRYPLRLGYIGVICKVPPQGLIRRSRNITDLVTKNEQAYFSGHPEYESCVVGSLNLRKQLMRVLANSMANSLQATHNQVKKSLEQISYQYKVKYNERNLTPESYVAQTVDQIKSHFKQISSNLDRQKVRDLLKERINAQVLDLLAELYWDVQAHEPNMTDLPQAKLDDKYWKAKLETATYRLTRLGIGRLSTEATVDRVRELITQICNDSSIHSHDFAKQQVIQASEDIIEPKAYQASDQVENCIKPLKYEIDIEEREWDCARIRALDLISTEIELLDHVFEKIRESVGSRYLGKVTSLLREHQDEDIELLEGKSGYSLAVLEKGKEALRWKQRAELLHFRKRVVSGKQCKSVKNSSLCPEVFLDVVAEKLVSTAVMFINVELISEFIHQFPREIDHRLLQSLTPEQIESFAREDPVARDHIDLQSKKDCLEQALIKIEGIMARDQLSRRSRRNARYRF